MKRKAEKPTAPEMQDGAGLVEDALSHPLRVRILGWMRHQAAKTQSEVGKALGLSNAAARYHLKVLEGADLVAFRGTQPAPTGSPRSSTPTTRRSGSGSRASRTGPRSSTSCSITPSPRSTRSTARRWA